MFLQCPNQKWKPEKYMGLIMAAKAIVFELQINK